MTPKWTHYKQFDKETNDWINIEAVDPQPFAVPGLDSDDFWTRYIPARDEYRPMFKGSSVWNDNLDAPTREQAVESALARINEKGLEVTQHQIATLDERLDEKLQWLQEMYAK